jgi:hypothetical protein
MTRNDASMRHSCNVDAPLNPTRCSCSSGAWEQRELGRIGHLPKCRSFGIFRQSSILLPSIKPQPERHQ